MRDPRLLLRSAAVILLASLSPARAGEPTAGAITWHAWSPEIFAQAKRENKFILLDLEAVWCHWCHVMAETTYPDPTVRRLM